MLLSVNGTAQSYGVIPQLNVALAGWRRPIAVAGSGGGG
jgi:hypothetical protein